MVDIIKAIDAKKISDDINADNIIWYIRQEIEKAALLGKYETYLENITLDDDLENKLELHGYSVEEELSKNQWVIHVSWSYIKGGKEK